LLLLCVRDKQEEGTRLSDSASLVENVTPAEMRIAAEF
jgi:hypothetical protein